MSLLLSEFHTLVSDGLGRGTSLDSVIPARVKMAVNWIEKNYTFQYMKEWMTFPVLAAAAYPYIVSLANIRPKKFELIRRRTTDSDGNIQFGRPLRKVNPADRESRPAGEPESYWLNGVNSIIFNSVPDEDMDFEAHVVRFTDWGSSSNFTHWLLDNATELLLAKSLQLMTVRTRDPGLYDMYEKELQKEIQAFNVAEEDLQTGDPVIAIWEPPEDATMDTSLRSA